MERYYFFILFGYLSGSILFARLLPKYLRHIDICELSEDNNPGVFNAFKHAGPVIGSMTLLLELAKGFLPVHVGLQLLDPRNTLFALVLAAPVFGHAFPLFRPKEGGKSIAAIKVRAGCPSGSRRKNEAKSAGKRLDKRGERDIIICVHLKNARTKPALRNRQQREGRRCKPLAHAARQPLRSGPRGAERFIPVTGWLRCPHFGG